MCFRAIIATLLTVPTLSHCVAAQDHADDSKKKTDLVRIIGQPKSSRPFDWKRGKKLTVGVRFVSAEGTKVIGVATDVELVATKTHKNRVEMMLRASPKRINEIRKAAEQSEYWFEIMPFNEKHIEMIKNGASPKAFAVKNRNYRPAGADNWGWGGKDGRLRPPKGVELPVRKKEQAEPSDQPKSPSPN